MRKTATLGPLPRVRLASICMSSAIQLPGQVELR
jgi:hypothetical protein